MQGKTCEDTLTAVANNVMHDDWKNRGGSIWNHGQERLTNRVKFAIRCRATRCQLVQLVKFMQQHKDLAVAHAQPFPGSDQLWQELARHINQFGPPKTASQCKTTWRDLRKRTFAIVRGGMKDGTVKLSRSLHGMVPQILRLIAAAGGLPENIQSLASGPGGIEEIIRSVGSVSSESCGSQMSTSEPPAAHPLPDSTPQPAPVPIKVEKTSSGDPVIIRVTDKLNSKTNVFNRFSVRDGHFENNVIVKEERDEVKQEIEESSVNMETDRERQEFSQEEEMFPEAEAILGDATNNAEEARDKLLQELNKTLSRFVAEYSERTQLMRERLQLDRARLQFDVQVFQAKRRRTEDS